MTLLASLDDLAADLLKRARNINSTIMADEIAVQLDVFNSVARFVAIKNKINPDEAKEGSIIDGYKKEIKGHHTGGFGYGVAPTTNEPGSSGGTAKAKRTRSRTSDYKERTQPQ
jgi:hypothetical protein